ncbi:MAG: Crp/Fnr family transcriptional regulator [Defluviitaleaceae bacterium]|nr:Crp/Fnr family transcriptional regulator [Defluviitaleaceae bacterium]
MSSYFDTIKKAPLFKGIGDEGLQSMLGCLDTEVKTVRKNGVVLLAGEKPTQIGVVLSGSLHVVKESLDGNQTLVASVLPGEIFGEAMCCAQIEESSVTVLADDDSEIMLINYGRIVHVCQNACGYHQKLVENMLELVARRNLYLQNRIEIMSIKSVRAKVLHYLESLAEKQGRSVAVPFNRTKLAEHLCVERTALAHELARMRQDGVIDYKKNVFTLKE